MPQIHNCQVTVSLVSLSAAPQVSARWLSATWHQHCPMMCNTCPVGPIKAVRIGSTRNMDFRLGLVLVTIVQSCELIPSSSQPWVWNDVIHSLSGVGLTCYTCIEGKKGVDNCMLSANCTGGRDVCALTWSGERITIQKKLVMNTGMLFIWAEYTSNVVSKGCGYSTW